MKMSVGVFAAAICAAVSVQAETWQVFSHNAKPTKNGVEQGDAEMSPAEQLVYAVDKADTGGGVIINLQKGVYDFSQMTPKAGWSAYLHKDFGSLFFYGEDTGHWSEKTREDETILIGGNGAPLFYGVRSGPRNSRFYNLSFENSTNTTVSGAGGAIAMTANEQTKTTPPSLVSNCVFRNCYSAFTGGGTSFISAFDCLYTNCTAVKEGGGAYGGCKVISGSTFPSTNTFQKCHFVDCSGSSGGGFYCAKGAADANATYEPIRGCTFERCRATSAGGGFYVPTPMEMISGCSFTDCRAADGGGVQVDGSLGMLTNCTFVSCGLTGGGNGGAVNTRNGARDDKLGCVADCSFAGCEAGNAGGGLFADHMGDVIRCAFTNNAAKSSGGAVYSGGEIGRIEDSTFVSNAVSSAAGGAICAMGTVTSADRCTFADNAAKTGAGGVNMNAASGVFTDCVFHSNTNNETVFGAHTSRALKMVRCRFSGYGDVCARDYDSCIFSNCVYRYCDPEYGSDVHGLITCPYAIGNGTIRNCLVQGCLVSRIIATEGRRLDVENCTFANNRIEDVPPEGKSTHAIMFFAFRGGNPTVASTNVYVNCIFADNWQLGQGDIDAFFQGSTSAAYPGYTAVTNCIYRTKYGTNAGKYSFSNFDMGDPKFVKDNAKFAGKYPDYMICRDSAAADKGLLLGWHAGGKDLLGNPRTHGTAVDIGAYESILPVAYVGDVDYETLEEAIAAAGATKRIGLYGDAKLKSVEGIAAERYFLEANGHTVTAPAGADVQVVQDTLSVKVSDIYEPAGDFNVMGGDVAGLIAAIDSSSAGKTVVLSPGVYDLTGLPEAAYTKVWTASSKDNFGKSSIVWNYTLTIKGACKMAWAERPSERETLLKNGGDMRIFYGYTGSGRASKIYNLSFEGGAATDASNAHGGAIVFGSASGGGFAKNCVFRNCSAEKQGGATWSLTAYDCLYSNCTASVWGGGAYGQATNDSSGHNTNFFENCTFVGCSAASGGAVYGSNLRWVTGCMFTNNTAKSGNGGAVYVDTGVQAVSNSTFACNKSTGSGVGGFYCSNLCGTFADCAFNSNTNSASAAKGAHICRGRDVRNCTFTGYGDVLARNLENCTFNGCVFTYDNTGRGLLTHDSSTDSGIVRNCLFANCTACRLCTTTNGKQCEFDNCTFADNKLLQGAGSACGYLFYAFRDPNLPSTNYISNCVFANNDGGVDTPAVKQCDVTCYGTSTSVPSHAPAANLFSNCAYEKGIYRGDGVKTEENCRKGNVKFAKDDPVLAGQYPDYMTKRSCAAHGLGAWADWMAGAKDLAGTDMPASAPVDAGCYQCTLQASGLLLMFK